MLQYSLSMPHPSSHLFEVSIRVETNGSNHVDLEFPAWSPGRYYIYDFARNVQELHAEGETNRLLTEKIAKGTWRIFCAGEKIVHVHYKMFGDSLSGTFSQLDDRHASINGSSLFGYIVDRNTAPILLEIHPPSQWKIYTALSKKRGRSNTFLAQNYDEFIDSPIEIGQPLVRKFAHDSIRYHVVVDLVSSNYRVNNPRQLAYIDKFILDTEKTVRAYTATFGRPDFDEYYFLVNIDPGISLGDGMEHLKSTRLVIAGHITNDDIYKSLVAVMSHEFFHIWNVKRMRPMEFGPFDYSREHHTSLLWFAEGFTQYYGNLMLRRAGVWDDKQLFRMLASEINAVDRSPGRIHRNLRDSSFDTWHAAGSRSPLSGFSNFKNTYVNYYFKGAVVAFMLDLEIRHCTHDRKSLDDIIRELYRRTFAETEIGDYYLRGSGYSEDDILDVVEKTVGITVRQFLKDSIQSVGDIDYSPFLNHVGLGLRRGKESVRSDEALPVFIGVVLGDSKNRSPGELIAINNVLEGSPADKAGMSAGDILLAIDGERIDGRNWEMVMATKEAGCTVVATVFRGIRLLSFSVLTQSRDTRSFYLVADAAATPKQRRSRRKWLSL